MRVATRVNPGRASPLRAATCVQSTLSKPDAFFLVVERMHSASRHETTLAVLGLLWPSLHNLREVVRIFLEQIDAVVIALSTENLTRLGSIALFEGRSA